MNTNSNTSTNIQSDGTRAIDALSSKANNALSGAEKFASDQAKNLREGIEHARAVGSEKLGMAADKLDHMASSIAKTYDQRSEDVRAYVKNEPLKAMAIAAVLGATLILVLNSLTRRTH